MNNFITFNINENVAVRLTDEGRRIHRKNYDDLMTMLGEICYEYRPPVEDEGGWYKCQMWMLLQDFGSHCQMGWEPPFETTIRIENKEKEL